MPECDDEDSRYDYVDSVFKVSEKEFLTENGISEILNMENFTTGSYCKSSYENPQPGMNELFH